MITAAFLHDIGRLLPLPAGADRLDDVHELRTVSCLAEGFGREVAEPIRLHETLPFAREAIQLRLYDDRAKIPGRKTPPLACYMALFEDNERRREAGRRPVCALSVA